MTDFHLEEQYPELIVRPAVEAASGIWVSDEPVVVDRNIISSRHPDDLAHFSKAIARWFGKE
jgi:protease I